MPVAVTIAAGPNKSASRASTVVPMRAARRIKCRSPSLKRRWAGVFELAEDLVGCQRCRNEDHDHGSDDREGDEDDDGVGAVHQQRGSADAPQGGPQYMMSTSPHVPPKVDLSQNATTGPDVPSPSNSGSPVGQGPLASRCRHVLAVHDEGAPDRRGDDRGSEDDGQDCDYDGSESSHCGQPSRLARDVKSPGARDTFIVAISPQTISWSPRAPEGGSN